MRDINPINNNGSIQLKFSFGGKRYSFNPIPGGDFDNKRDMATAKAIAIRIQNDILAGRFDPTLDRYRLSPKAPTKPQPITILELWDLWVESLELPLAVAADDYRTIRQMLVKANPAISDTSWLVEANLAPVTFNKRLSYLKSCGKWAVGEGFLDHNPFRRIKPRKASRKVIKPFTTNEIQRILAGFQDKAPHYVPFVKFLFLTGARLSEAIGFRWGHVDFDRNELIICESLPKDLTGNGYQRVRKETKTGIIRYLTMRPELRGLLQDLQPEDTHSDHLVFITVEGCIIDADNFRARYWKPILAECNVPYRKIHNIRHTTLSMAIEQGTPITGVAYMAGHTDTRMVIQTYGHMINRPNLPHIPV